MKLLVAACCIAAFLTGCASNSEPPRISGAWAACQIAVEQGLKAPATAEFPTYSNVASREVGNTIQFPSTYVDSQNSYGAQIRTNFTCWADGTTADTMKVTYLVVDGTTLIDNRYPTPPTPAGWTPMQVNEYLKACRDGLAASEPSLTGQEAWDGCLCPWEVAKQYTFEQVTNDPAVAQRVSDAARQCGYEKGQRMQRES